MDVDLKLDLKPIDGFGKVEIVFGKVLDGVVINFGVTNKVT